jgi:hypothetical protein
MSDLEDLGTYWRAQPHDGVHDVAVTMPPTDAPREVSEEQFRRICAEEQAFAAKNGGPRNPFV